MLNRSPRPIALPLLALSLLALAALVSAYPLRLVQPAAWVAEGDSVRYGSVGPGQTFVVQIEPIARGPEGAFAGQWDMARASQLPEGWTARPSKLNQKPLQVEITPSPDTPDGEYAFTIEVQDEQGLDNLAPEGKMAFGGVVRIDHDVLRMRLEPSVVEVGAGQPARVAITLENVGSANDVFDVSASGVKGWAFHKSVYLAAGQTKTITYEVAGFDEADYGVQVDSRSTASPLIAQSQPLRLSVRTNLLSDYKATSHGVLLFPILQAPLYGLAGLLGALFP